VGHCQGSTQSSLCYSWVNHTQEHQICCPSSCTRRETDEVHAHEVDNPASDTDQRLSQYWFAGNHSNVGGGNNDMTLANITLAWMIGQLTSEIQFNQRQIWAITTTREWSKPSPENDKETTKDEEASSDSRNCKVVAKAFVSSDICMYIDCR
jgi:hypothetical protein